MGLVYHALAKAVASKVHDLAASRCVIVDAVSVATLHRWAEFSIALEYTYLAWDDLTA